jgi:hypothetical protein
MLTGRFIAEWEAAEWEALRHSEIRFFSAREIRSRFGLRHASCPAADFTAIQGGTFTLELSNIARPTRKGPDKPGPLSFAVETAKKLTFQADGEGCRRRCSSPNL